MFKKEDFKKIIGETYVARPGKDCPHVQFENGNNGEEKYYRDAWDKNGLIYSYGESCKVLNATEDYVDLINDDVKFTISMEQFICDFIKGDTDEINNNNISDEIYEGEDVFEISELNPEYYINKKKEIRFYDTLDNIAEEAYTEMLSLLGIKIEEINDYSPIKDIVSIVIEKAKEFGQKIPYVKENY